MSKICIITFGCSLNISDSEIMAGILKEHDFEMVSAPALADIIIINTCTVKHTTETNFWKLLKNLKEKGKPIIIAGCIAQTDPERLGEFSLIGTTQINNIAFAVEETLAGNIVKMAAKQHADSIFRFTLPKIRRNPVVEILPISQGCLGSCSYCKTKAARFELQSYDLDAVICHAKAAIKEGVKELWVTSQDTAVYGQDIKNKKVNLAALLKKLAGIKGDFMIRLGMGNPGNVLKCLGELIDAFKLPKMFKFLHVPVQSGNNDVLKAMNRDYTVEGFKTTIKRFRQQIPNITIATDIIAGFPGETDEQFYDSLKLIREIRPDVLNISRYSARPKTKAALLPQLPGGLIKERSRILTQTFEHISFERNRKWNNWAGCIIIDEKGKEGTNTMIGRNPFYKPVIVDNPKDKPLKLGESLRVRITCITKHDLRGKIEEEVIKKQ